MLGSHRGLVMSVKPQRSQCNPGGPVQTADQDQQHAKSAGHEHPIRTVRMFRDMKQALVEPEHSRKKPTPRVLSAACTPPTRSGGLPHAVRLTWATCCID